MPTPAALPAAFAAAATTALCPISPVGSDRTAPVAEASGADDSAEPGEPPQDVPEPIAAAAPATVASSGHRPPGTISSLDLAGRDLADFDIAGPDFAGAGVTTLASPGDTARITPSQAAVASSPAAVAAVTGSQSKALLVGLALVLVWGVNYSVQKLTFPVIGPDGFLFARYLILPVLAIALMVHRFGIDWPPVDRADRTVLFKLALAGPMLHVGLVTWGIHLSTAFSSSVMSAVGPLFTLLLLRLSGSAERLGATKIAGVAVAMSGILVFLSDKLLAEGWQAGWGDLVLLVAAIFFSYYTVAAKDVIIRIGGMPVMCYTTLIASPLMVAVSWQASMTVDWLALDWQVWAGLLWSVIVSAFFGWVLWGWVNAVRGVARTAPLMYLTPVVAGLCAWVVLGEQFSAIKFVGAGLTLAGVALAQARFGSAVARPGVPAPAPERAAGRRGRADGIKRFGSRSGDGFEPRTGGLPFVPARIQPPDED